MYMSAKTNKGKRFFVANILPCDLLCAEAASLPGYNSASCLPVLADNGGDAASARFATDHGTSRLAMPKSWSRGMQFATRQICLSCGKEFYAPPSLIRRGGGKYCSVACRAKEQGKRASKPKAIIVCQHCGKTYEVHQCHVARSRYCSVECRNAGRTKPRISAPSYKKTADSKQTTPTPKRQKESKEVVKVSAAQKAPIACRQRIRYRTCLYCGTLLSSTQKKYCSHHCYTEHHKATNIRKVQIRNCEVCGKEFEARECELAKGQARFCSRRCFGAGKVKVHTDTQYSRCRGGKRADLNGQYFRSRWEANYARYLNWLVKQGEIEKWEYETDTFEFVPVKRGNKFYTPDFKIFNRDGSIEYHEIKGWMDNDSRVRLTRMARYYPQVKLIVIEKDAYKAIAMQARNLVEGWERDDKHTY
jgi:hypothetical protein